jgi:hypothetical protein
MSATFAHTIAFAAFLFNATYKQRSRVPIMCRQQLSANK